VPGYDQPVPPGQKPFAHRRRARRLRPLPWRHASLRSSALGVSYLLHQTPGPGTSCLATIMVSLCDKIQPCGANDFPNSYKLSGVRDSRPFVSEFFAENERSRILQLLNSVPSLLIPVSPGRPVFVRRSAQSCNRGRAQCIVGGRIRGGRGRAIFRWPAAARRRFRLDRSLRRGRRTQ
jgi:hypothetical protein